MRVLGSLLLTVVLLLQSLAAAASGLCVHEQGPGAQHPGHHVHQHAQSTADVAQPSQDTNSPAERHADCGICHLMHATTALPSASTQSPGPASDGLPRSILRAPASWVVPPLDRPNWAL